MNYNFQEILDVGLEFEFSNIKRDTGHFMETLIRKTGGNFKAGHDASAESPEICIGNIPVQFHVGNKYNKLLYVLKNKPLETVGGEMNSPVMSSKVYREYIYKLVDFFQEMGESYSTTEQDNRGSIHIHINVTRDIRHEHLIRLLEVGLATESIFYKLAGMGRINRGVKNNFIYQRPLTLPPCVNFNGKIYPIFDYKDLLHSTSKEDFFNKYGDTISNIENGNHYVTQRYTGLNFYSIPYRGSIEFRYFNKTLIPEWICATIALCQSFVNYALTKEFNPSFEKEYRKLEDNKDVPTEDFIYILNKLGVSEDDQITLLDIWYNSTMPHFDGKYILTHLDNPTFFRKDLGYKTKPLSLEEIVEHINVENVRKIQDNKNNILNKVRREEQAKSLDYVLEDNGNLLWYPKNMKQQEEPFLGEINIREYHAAYELSEEVYDNYFRVKEFNIEDYTIDDVTNFCETRLAVGKFLPLRILEKHSWYTFNTRYDDIVLFIRVIDDYDRLIEYYMTYEQNHDTKIYKSLTTYKESFASMCYDFTDLINNAHFNPDDYFEGLDDNYIMEEDDNNMNNIENDINNFFVVDNGGV